MAIKGAKDAPKEFDPGLATFQPLPIVEVLISSSTLQKVRGTCNSFQELSFTVLRWWPPCQRVSSVTYWAATAQLRPPMVLSYSSFSVFFQSSGFSHCFSEATPSHLLQGGCSESRDFPSSGQLPRLTACLPVVSLKL